MLHESGIAVGRDLIPADEGNVEGYYEERAVVEVNDAIVQSAGLGAFFATASREQIVECARPLRERMVALASCATPAWKDPRFCWTLEAWLPHLASPARVIVCLRNPGEVVSSTMRYFGMADDDGRRAVEHVWRCENERLLEIIETHALDATCARYDELVERPDAVASQLSAFVGARVHAEGVRAELRHHAETMPPEHAELYERVASVGR
jgi:hypothetical protein